MALVVLQSVLDVGSSRVDDDDDEEEGDDGLGLAHHVDTSPAQHSD